MIDVRSRSRAFLANLLGLQYREVVVTAATTAVLGVTVLCFPGTDRVFDGFGGAGSIDPPTLLLLFVVVVLAATVKAAAGFGAALVATPLFSSVIDPATAVVVLGVMPWTINLVLVGETRTGVEYARTEWPLVLFAVLGTLVGVYALAAFELGESIRAFVGVVVLAYVAFEALSGMVTIEAARHPVGSAVTGGLGGFLVATANVGPVFPAYLHVVERDPERYVGGLALIYTLLFTIRLCGLYSVGLLTPYRLWLGSAIATAALGGLVAGTVLRRRVVGRSTVNHLILVLLFVVGLRLVWTSLASGTLAKLVP